MRRKAFTILELLAATALTALLMLAVMHVIASIGRTRAGLADQRNEAVTVAWKSDLLDSLRHDLSNSTGMRAEQNEVVLTGHAALDRTTLSPGHEPVTVTYGITTIAGRAWLYRRQAPRDDFRGAGPWQELLCPDVTGFTVRPVLAAAAPTTGPTRGNQTDDAVAVPAAVTVLLEGPRGRVIEETLVIR